MVNDGKDRNWGALRLAMAAANREDVPSPKAEQTTFWLSHKGVFYPMPDPEDEARSTYYIYTDGGLTILRPALD